MIYKSEDKRRKKDNAYSIQPVFQYDEYAVEVSTAKTTNTNSFWWWKIE